MEKVRVYSKPNCKNCDKVKKFLEEHKIDYINIDLTDKEERESRKLMSELGVKDLPVLIGFDYDLEERVVEGEDYKSILKCFANQLSPEEEKKIEDRLKALGYL